MENWKLPRRSEEGIHRVITAASRPGHQLHHSSSNMTAQTAGPCWPGVSIQTVASNHVYSSPQQSAEHIMSGSLSVIFAMETSLWVVSKNPIANPRFLGFLRVFLNHISLVFSSFLPIFEGNAEMKSPCLRQCLYYQYWHEARLCWAHHAMTWCGGQPPHYGALLETLQCKNILMRTEFKIIFQLKYFLFSGCI